MSNPTSKFLDKLASGALLGDGAMGTQLFERGIYINRNFDALNLSDPHLVKAVHHDYLKAGAQVIETNTYGANPIKLGHYGLAEKTYEINKVGVELARACAESGAEILVAGSVGPLGKPIEPMGKISASKALEAFQQQVEGLLAGGLDLFMLETFYDLNELLIAIQAVRQQSDLPIAALLTIDQTGWTAYGRSPEQIAAVLDQQPVDVIGLNCSIGPQNVLEGIKRMRSATDKPLAAFPNAGEPQMVEGRILYLSTPEYFATYAKRLIKNGVRFLGGCCGTTPKHISAMAGAVKALTPANHKSSLTVVPKITTLIQDKEQVTQAPRAERSLLGKLLAENAFPISCEINPPRSPNINKILKQAELLRRAGINIVNVPDGPRASARMSAMALAHILKRESGLDTILHYTCRDRNILGMQSDLLGAEALGLDNILCVTGDPPKLGDYPMATAVFDVDAIGLLRIASELNHSRDLAGNPISHPTTFLLGAGFNPGAIDLDHEIERLHEKIATGAEYILTQPVFDPDKLLLALQKAGSIETPVLVGILPLASYRNAEFYHNEVPGMEVPAAIRQRMKAASDRGKELGMLEGIAIAQEALLAVLPYVQGAYIMPPFGKVELAIETAAALPGRKALAEIEGEVRYGKVG